MTNTKILTPAILRTWGLCSAGYNRFCELLPEGGVLQQCVDVLAADNHNEWGYWLFNRAIESEDFKEQTLAGYRNSGYRNSGDRNAGSWNAGNCNSGSNNSGNENAGSWNAGSCNSGFFNSSTPDDILVFNKPCTRSVWEMCKKPDFIFMNLTIWVTAADMTPQEKIDHPSFANVGGYLKTLDYKEAWTRAWSEASAEDKRLLKELPNFDSKVFFEITGIVV